MPLPCYQFTSRFTLGREKDATWGDLRILSGRLAVL